MVESSSLEQGDSAVASDLSGTDMVESSVFTEVVLFSLLSVSKMLSFPESELSLVSAWESCVSFTSGSAELCRERSF